MRLHNIISGKGSTHSRKRLGRGHGSGHGKTSGRGHKGQRARAGASQRPGFESGHVPLYRKLPKRGFNNKDFKKTWRLVNVGDLARIDESVTEINNEALIKAGLIRDNRDPIKVLGDGEITRAVTLRADHFSATAKAKIEKAGGQAVLLNPPAEDTEAPAESEPAAES